MKFALSLALAACVSARSMVEGGSTFYEHTIASQEEADANLNNWFDMIGKPFLNQYRDQVYTAALAKVEAKQGPLLATCDKGTECREENEKVIQSRLDDEWRTVMDSFRDDIEATIVKTELIIEEGWETAVECEVDAPCCTISTSVFDNLVRQIHQKNELIKTL